MTTPVPSGVTVHQREELARLQDFVVVGVDKTVHARQYVAEEGPGRIHGLARHIDRYGSPIRVLTCSSSSGS